MNLKSLAVGALFAASAPFAANAVTMVGDGGSQPISIGDFVIGEGLVNPGDLDLDFTLTATEALRITFIASNLQPDARTGTDTVEIFVNGMSALTTMGMPGLSGNRVFDLGSWDLAMGDMLVIGFSTTSVVPNQAAVFDFSADVTAIPLPAAGWLFVSALGGVGLLARRRTQTV